MLADLGADVLRVEQRGTGDMLRGIPGAHTAYNHGKRSMSLDVRHAAAPEVLRRLATDSDVLLESGQLDKQGLGPVFFTAANPRLVWCSLTGWGEGSPYGDRPGHDISFQGYSGVLSMMAGESVPGTPDVVVAVPVAALMAAIGILAALRERDRTGLGRQVDLSIVDASTWLLGEHLTRVSAGLPAGWGESASRRAYRCSDGRLITVAAAEPRTWQALCAGLDLPDLVDQLYTGDQAAMTARLAALFATRPMAEWVQLLSGGAVGPVCRVEELAQDEHVRARGSVVTLDDGESVIAGPVRLVGADAPSTEPAPELGADTGAILAEAGFSPEEITELERDGVI